MTQNVSYPQYSLSNRDRSSKCFNEIREKRKKKRSNNPRTDSCVVYVEVDDDFSAPNMVDYRQELNRTWNNNSSHIAYDNTEVRYPVILPNNIYHGPRTTCVNTAPPPSEMNIRVNQNTSNNHVEARTSPRSANINNVYALETNEDGEKGASDWVLLQFITVEGEGKLPFEMRYNSVLGNAMQAFAARMGLYSYSDVLYFLNGEVQLYPNDSPSSLGLKNGDCITVVDKWSVQQKSNPNNQEPPSQPLVSQQSNSCLKTNETFSSNVALRGNHGAAPNHGWVYDKKSPLPPTTEDFHDHSVWEEVCYPTVRRNRRP